MKEDKFLYLDSHDHEFAKKGENVFLNQEVITQKDIKNIAKGIAAELRSEFPQLGTTEERKAVIVDWLNVASQLGLHKLKNALENQGHKVEKHKKEEYGPGSDDDFIRIRGKEDDDFIDLYKKDVDEASTRIRRAILEELKNHFPDADFFPMEKDLYDGCVYQAGHDWVIKFYIVSLYDGKHDYYKKYGDDVDKSIKKLYELDERCPYIAYNIAQRDPEMQVELQHFQDMETFEDLLGRDNKPEFSKMMEYYNQILQATKFLIDHNFRLTDFALDNLAVDTKRDVGILFDMGNLFSEDLELKGDYATHADYLPPERMEGIQRPDLTDLGMMFGEPIHLNEGLVTEEEMVYELGVALGKILDVYKISDPLRILQQQMINQRISFKQILETFNQEMSMTA
ncbi:MAG: hypothetical protein ABID45_00365 [Patescibacteria group bacterium]